MSISTGTTAPSNWAPSRWAFRFAIVCVLVCPVIAFGETNDATNLVEVRKLIRNLGAGQFVARESATKKLFQMGVGEHSEIAIKEITRASLESDREVRERAKRILDLVKSRLRDEGLKQFLAGKKIENVPGWKQFSTKYGESEASRSVFTMILKEEWNLLATCLDSDDADTKDAAPEQSNADADNRNDLEKTLAPSQIAVRRTAINERYSQVMSGQYRFDSVPLGSILGFFIVGEAAPESFELNTQLFQMMFSASMLRQQLRGVPQEDTPRRIIRQIVKNWMISTVKHDSRYETQALSTAIGNRMGDEAKLVAAHILKNPDSLAAVKRAAMQTFVVFRDPTGIELIEPYLTDKTLLTPNRKKLQLRDMALTCLMDLHGHDVSLIGVQEQANFGNPYNFPSLGFDTEELRQEAFNLFEELQDEKARKQRESEKKKAKVAQ